MAAPESDRTAFIGDPEDLKTLYDDNLPQDFLAKLEHAINLCSFGECEIEKWSRYIEKCNKAVFFLSKQLLQQDGNDNKKYFFVLLFCWKKMASKPKCAVLLDIGWKDLPIGLKNMRTVYLKESDSLQRKHEKLKRLDWFLKESGKEIKNLGNISQGQAFSNYFGYFNIIFPHLPQMWSDFKKLRPELTGMMNAKPSIDIFEKFVEIVMPDGENPSMKDLGFQDVGTIFPTEEEQRKVTDLFTRLVPRCGAAARPYMARLHRVYNDDKSKSYLFVGQVAPSGNVFHKLTPGKEGERHRRCYALTSQAVSDHPENEIGVEKLLVLEIKDKMQARQEVFTALETHKTQIPEPQTREVKKCQITVFVPTDLTELVENCLKSIPAIEEVSKRDFGESVLEEPSSDVDLCLLVLDMTELKTAEDSNKRLGDVLAKCNALLPTASVLVIKKCENACDLSGCDQVLEMCPFTRQYQSIDEGLVVTSSVEGGESEFERNLKEYVQCGPKHLQDMLLISNIYNGLAQAFVCNYLKIQYKGLTRLAENSGASTMRKLYQLIPKSENCARENFEEIVDKTEDIKNREIEGRKYTTVMCWKTIDGIEYSFFMEYCTPIQVLIEMYNSRFVPLLTDEDKRREINKFILHLQDLLNEDEELRDFVTLIPLGDEVQKWKEVVTKVIKNDILTEGVSRLNISQ